MTQKEKLYYLIENYYKSHYNTKSFCDQFILIYSEGINDCCNKKEKVVFQQFCELAERYSPFDEDLKLSTFFVDEKTFRDLFIQLYEKNIKKTGNG